MDRPDRAIERASPALHTDVPIGNYGFCSGSVHLKNQVRTDSGTYSATDTGLLIELQCNNTVKIVKSFHGINTPVIKTKTPVTQEVSMSGRAYFISLRTPDGDVKGVLPVKFMA